MTSLMARGSLADTTKSSNLADLAKAMLKAKAVCIVDISSSMGIRDSIGGKSRYESACTELAKIQEQLSGRIAIVDFNDIVSFRPKGIPGNPMGSTDLTAALEFVSPTDNAGLEFIVISDGEPNNPYTAANIAEKFISPIHTIYVGPEGGVGESFLKSLARNGGEAREDYRVNQLSSVVIKLLSGDKS